MYKRGRPRLDAALCKCSMPRQPSHLCQQLRQCCMCGLQLVQCVTHTRLHQAAISRRAAEVQHITYKCATCMQHKAKVCQSAVIRQSEQTVWWTANGRPAAEVQHVTISVPPVQHIEEARQSAHQPAGLHIYANRQGNASHEHR